MAVVSVRVFENPVRARDVAADDEHGADLADGPTEAGQDCGGDPVPRLLQDDEGRVEARAAAARGVADAVVVNPETAARLIAVIGGVASTNCDMIIALW